MNGNTRPTRQELGLQLRNVLRDLPVFLTLPLYRRWHRRARLAMPRHQR